MIDSNSSIVWEIAVENRETKVPVQLYFFVEAFDVWRRQIP
eukprot:COSAG05_NODE_8507_length_697_cov_1.747492_1_plen_40_part_01